MPIKMKSGKDYYTVVERMDMMIEEKGREDYSLETEVTYESGVVIVKATLTLFNCYPKDETDTVEVVSRKYVGHALGELGKAKTLEATETHAIGRALSSAGWYGSEFASANEMETYQTKPKPETTKTKTTKSKESDLIEEVIEKYDGVEVKNVINFGKHNGKEWKDLDESYVQWVATKSNVDWQRDAANEELQRRKNSGVQPKDVTNTKVSKDELEDVPF
jgi:hypothetical protein